MRSILIIFLYLLIISCEDTSTNNTKKYYEVKYRVDGTAETVFVTIESQDGGTSQFNDVSPPWNYIFDEKQPEGTFVYISAQNMTNAGSVIVEIYRDGEIFKQTVSSGSYVIATASGSL